jgi:hypothetical protein
MAPSPVSQLILENSGILRIEFQGSLPGLTHALVISILGKTCVGQIHPRFDQTVIERNRLL